MSRRIVIAICLAALVPACAAEPDRKLFDIEEVGPDRLEPGMRVHIRGASFPLGKAAEVLLAGVLHRPGMAPRSVRSAIGGEVDSSDLVVVPVTDAWLDELGGRGTFVGRVRVGFRSEQGALIYGEQSVRLDMVPAVKDELGRQVEATGRANALAQSLGLRLSNGDFAEVGLEVLDVWPNSAAARSGIERGDRIVELDEIRLYSLADFVPSRERHISHLRVHRPTTLGTFVMPVRFGVVRSPTAHPLARVVVLALLGLLMGFFVPFATLVEWLRPARQARTGLLRSLFSVLDVQTLTIASLSLLCCALAAKGVLPKLGWWIGAALVMSIARRAGQRAHGGSSLSAPLLCMVLVLVGMVLISGSFAIESVVEKQGAAPWHWWLFKHPAAFLLSFPAMFAFGSVKGPMRRSVSYAIYRAVGCFLVVTLLMGGWAMPAEGSRAVGWLLLAVKLLVVVPLVGSLRVDERGAWWFAGLGVALAAVMFWFVRPETIAHVATPLLVGLSVGALLHAVASSRWTQPPLLIARWQL